MNQKSKQNHFPFVSFILPTYNAEKYFRNCLRSIFKQDYPYRNFEVLVVDGGSTDGTKKIAREFKVRLINNPFKDPESGKSIGIELAKGEIIALLDSDNEIIKKDWLQRMVLPLIKDKCLFGVESFYFPKKGESIFNSYLMFAHIADPFSRCLAANLRKKEMEGYTELTIPQGAAYPLGANGFLWNRRVIEEVGAYKPKFEESNFSYFAAQKGYRKFARVTGYGIYHHHIDSLTDFIQKRLKIGNKFLDRRYDGKKTWLGGVSRRRFISAVVYCGTFFGPLLEGTFNSFKTGQRAWFLHPVMSFVSVATYGIVLIRRRIKI